MVALGITRRELCRRTGLSRSVVNNVCSGFANPGNGAKRLIEVAIGAPIWSTPDDFNALTQIVNRHAQQFPQITQTEKSKK